MPRLRENRITAADLMEYLRGYSDFSFELEILRMLRAHGLECEHGGLYEDPTTKKTREFDIRAVARVASGNRGTLAIECKNIREFFPLLVSCVPRHPSESFNDFAIVSELQRPSSYSPPALSPRAFVVRASGDQSYYKPLAPVGKSLAQVGRTADRDANIYATDSEVFEEWLVFSVSGRSRNSFELGGSR